MNAFDRLGLSLIHIYGMSFTAKVTSDCLYGPFLEDGTSKMAARPHCERIAQDALPQAIAIYSEQY